MENDTGEQVVTSTVEDSIEEKCSICLDNFCMKTKLQCGHIFCFLCIKGAIANNNHCPMCRQRVSANFFISPQICDNIVPVQLFDNAFLWYYEASDGWWMYERRDSLEIERSFQQNPDEPIEKLISGRIYVIDFSEMVQYPKNIPTRRRRIKRDIYDTGCRGIAGVSVDLRL